MKIGVACSPGLAIEKAYILEEPEISIDVNCILQNQVEDELDKLEKAFNQSKEQVDAIYQKTLLTVGEKDAEIIQAHLMILEDPIFYEEIKDAVKNELWKAEHAIMKKVEEQVAVFEMIDDPYIKERAADIKDVGNRLLMNALGLEIKDISCMEEEVIIVGHDITPSLMATLDRNHVKGIIAEVGGATAHTAILARNMEIPAILGASGVLSMVKDGQILMIDGSKGEVEIDPEEEKVVEIKKKIEKARLIKRELSQIKNLPSSTRDGHHIELVANIGLPIDTEKALEYGAEGVGLFRTEFLYMDRNSQPDEEEQFASYKKVLQDMSGKPVIIRTLDVGGDKEIPYFNLPKEENPFLGYRAIRICLEDTELFKTQLRAILRASKFGKALVMFPMISGVEEVIRAKAILEEAKEELRQRNQEFDDNIKVGIMVEIPSAAIAADLFSEEIDFFSIGTNDLTQYTLAVDRGNTNVSKIYNGFHPALLRLFKNVIEASEKKGKFTGMCGELAGNPLATLLLLGMGFHELSMSPSSILKVKKIVTSVDRSYAQKVAQHAMSLTRAEE
ncbi:phosphoenolpyruvate--protein phosphotransferase, partial [Sinanaerobacter chloroacetimidivorans]